MFHASSLFGPREDTLGNALIDLAAEGSSPRTTEYVGDATGRSASRPAEGPPETVHPLPDSVDGFGDVDASGERSGRVEGLHIASSRLQIA